MNLNSKDNHEGYNEKFLVHSIFGGVTLSHHGEDFDETIAACFEQLLIYQYKPKYNKEYTITEPSALEHKYIKEVLDTGYQKIVISINRDEDDFFGCVIDIAGRALFGVTIEYLFYNGKLILEPFYVTNHDMKMMILYYRDMYNIK